MRGDWKNSGLSLTRGHTFRSLMLLGLSFLTVGLLTTGLVFAGPARDRSKRSQQVERTAAADPRVVVSACTLSGSFTVRSWDRREVRVRISDGVQIELTRTDQTKSASATELDVTSKGRRLASGRSCLMFGDMEMDVPRGAKVKLQTTSGDIFVTDLARVNVVATSGSIKLAKIRAETDATVIGGDISVRDSFGFFKLHSTGGSVDVRDVAPLVDSDSVTASTVSGEVTLSHVQHQRVSVNAVSGDVMYSGALTPGGSYSFQNLSGDVGLSLPATASFRLLASVGESATIKSDFALKYTENQNMNGIGHRGGPRRVSATVGSGSASIRVSTLTGSLRITRE